ncbi:MAG TPA: hypothetical protein VF219_21795, partial [Vicinamibacterales bacterium]
MHRQVAVATIFVCLVTPLFSAAYAQSCPPPTPPPITLQNAEICLGAQDAASTTPGLASYVWSATHGSIVSSDQSGNVTFTADGSGDVTLSVTVTDSAGCPSTGSTTVRLRTIPPPVIHAYPDAICPGGFGRVYIDPPDPNNPYMSWANVQWAITNGTITNQNGMSVDFTSDPAGTPVTITVTATDAQGCSNSASSTYLVRSIPPPVIHAFPDSIISGSPGNAFIDPPDPNNPSIPWSSVHWTISNGTITNDRGTGVDFTTDATSGYVTLTVSVTDNQSCGNSASVAIPVQASVSGTIHLDLASVCLGGYDNATVDQDPNNPWTSITWSIQNGSIIYGQGTTRINFQADGSGNPVALSVSASNSSGTTQSSISVPIHTNPPPVIELGSGSCPNTATVANASSFYAFMWSGDGVNISGGWNSATVTFYPTRNGHITLSVRVYDYSGCDMTSTYGWDVSGLPDVTISISPGSHCAGGSPITVSVPDGGPGVTYQWSSPSYINFIGSTTSPTVTFVAPSSGSAEVTITATNAQGCSAQSVAGIAIWGQPLNTFSSVPASVCQNGTGTISVYPNILEQFNWAVTDGDIVSGQGTNSLTFTPHPGAASVTVQVTITETGCPKTIQQVIAVAAPSASITPSGPTTFCPGGSVTLAASAGASYLWSNGATTQSITVNATGNYSVTVTDAGGCSATSAAASVTVSSPVVPTISASGPTTFCAGGSVTLTASAASSYLWSTGATTQAITVNASGSYSVTTTDANGCGATSAATSVTVNPLPVAAVNASGPTTFCAGGSVTLTASNASSYLWSNGATTQSIVVNASGNYSVAVTDSNGCSSTTAATTVTVNPLPTPTISASGPTTFCAGGNVTLTASSASSYLWSNGATTQAIAVNASGSYSVTATDAHGCSATSAATTVTVNPLPVAAVDVPSSICINTTAHAFVSGTFASVHWQVTNNAQILGNPNNPNLSFRTSNSTPITVSLTVTNSNGCSSTYSYSVGVNPLPTPQISGAPSICVTDTGSLNVTNPTAGSSWTWSLSNATILGVFDAQGNPNPNGSRITYQPTAAGQINITLTETNANGCRGTTSGIVVANAPTLSDFTVAAVCPGATGTASSNSPYAVYSWSITNGTILSGANAHDVTFRASTDVNNPTTLTLTTTSYCVTPKTKTVPWSTIPPPYITLASQTVCPATNSYATVVDSYSSYAWTITNGTIVSGANTHTVTYTAGASGNVTLTLVVNSGGCSSSSTVNVPIEDTTPPAITAPDTICYLGTFTASVPAGYDHYAWWYDNVTEVSVTPNSNSVMLRSDGTGRPIDLRVTMWRDSGMGCQTIATKTVTYAATPTPVIGFSVPANFCTGMTGQASVTNGPYASYAWTISGGAISGPANGSTVSFIPDGSATPQLTVQVTDGRGNCTATGFGVSPFANFKPTVYSNNGVDICASATTTLSLYGSSTPDTYLWSTGATTPTISVNTAGDYTLTTTINGCSMTSAPLHINVHTASATLTADKTTYCAGAAPATLSVTNATGFTGQVRNIYWYATDTQGAIAGGYQVYGHTASNYTRTYYAVVSDENGCSATTNQITITVNPLPAPTITASGPTAICAGGSVTLTASTASSYLWSNGATTQAITVNAAGSYSVTVTNANGCSGTSAATNVTVNPLPTPTISASGATTFCTGGSVTLTASSASSYLWSNGATTRAITVNASGNYSVTITDANGCSAASAATSVTVNPLPAPTISASGATTFCAGGNVTLTASSASSYLWSNGATTQAIVVNASGNYSVTVTNANGCSATSAATAVTVNPLPTPTVSASGPTTFCAGGNVTLTATSASSYLWSNGATTQAINVNASGNYSVTVTDVHGCSATSAATTVTVNPLPTPAISASGATTFCSGGSVTLTASSASSYLWSNGATTQSIIVNTSGNYSVTETDSNGCSATSQATTVTAFALPAPTISASGATTFCAGGSVTLTASSASSYLWSNGATTQAINVNTSGNYSVTETDSNGCSATSAATTVTVNSNPAPSITAPPAICAGGTGSASTAAITGATYAWTITNGTITSGSGTNAITFTSASGAVTLGVTVTNSNSCSGTASATVNVNALPNTTITPNGPTTFCQGGSVTLSAPAGMSQYAWSNGATTQSINVSTSGTYSVTVTNANGCSATSSG